MQKRLARLSPAGRDYIAAFDIAAVAMSACGRQVHPKSNRCRRRLVVRIRRRRARGHGGSSWSRRYRRRRPAWRAPYPACGPGRPRCPAARRLDGPINTALRDGTLKAFNRVYRARRAAAVATGERFMSYSQAQRRLRAVLAGAVASGIKPASLIAQVLG